VSVEYPDLADFLAIAAAVTGIDTDVLIRSAKRELADSALHAPQGSWDDQEFYPDFVDKAAVLLVRLAKITPFSTATSRQLG
jgi:death-on-curing protein